MVNLAQAASNVRQVKRWSDNDTLFKATMDKQMTLFGYRKENVAAAIGMSRATFYSKYNCPNKFTLDEIRRVYSFLKIDGELNII